MSTMWRHSGYSGQASYRELCGLEMFHMMTEIEYSWTECHNELQSGYALCSCMIQLRNKGCVSWQMKILGSDKRIIAGLMLIALPINIQRRPDYRHFEKENLVESSVTLFHTGNQWACLALQFL